MPELQYTGRFGLDLVDLKEDQFLSRKVNGSEGAGSAAAPRTATRRSNRYVIESFLTFVPHLGTRSELDATGGASVELTRTELNFIRGDGFSSDELTQVSNAAVISEGDGTNSRNNLVSFFARANYTLDRKYIFGGSVRTDGSSRFGAQQPVGLLPLGLGGVGAQRGVLPQGGLLRLPQAPGELRPHRQPGDLRLSVPGLITDANYGDTPGIAPSNLANPDLKWETTKQFDIGTDMALAKGRISLTADYYEKRTNDLLLERPISGTSGFATVFDNVGGVLNKGLELGLTTVNIDSRKTDGFRWTTTLNLATESRSPRCSTTSRSTTASAPQPGGGGRAARRVLHPAIYRGRSADRRRHLRGPERRRGPSPPTTRPSSAARRRLDRRIHQHHDLQGIRPDRVPGHQPGERDLQRHADLRRQRRLLLGQPVPDVLQRWQKPGDITNVPRASYDCASGAADISNRYIEDGSYWRLQDLTLGYRLPEKWPAGSGSPRPGSTCRCAICSR